MRQYLLAFVLFSLSLHDLHAQQEDVQTSPVKQRKKFYKTGLFKAIIVPSVLIGYGVSTIHEHGFYSSYDAYHDIHKAHFKRTHVDDYLQYAPYAELALLNIFQIKCKNDFINTALLVVKSEILMNGIVFPLKSLTHITRPDSMNPARDHSFPSGHTANAFLAASIVHKEYKHRSAWYGIGAYTIATSVGVFRMLNNRHWEADVFAGAGFGMLSVHLAYLTHRYRWGRKCDAMIIPTYQKGSMGLCFYKKF
ncbi:MAG: phosphatase PAP2 family protein [Cytophagaceae bacterium]